jgi:hypothetical protein
MVFAEIAKSWRPYRGKGKRTGTPGRYRYDYSEGVNPAQLDLLAWGESEARKRLLEAAAAKATEELPPRHAPGVTKRIRGETHFARHGRHGAPAPGAKGYKGPAPPDEHTEAAHRTLVAVKRMFEDAEWFQSYQWHVEHGSGGEEDPVYGHTLDDLGAMVGARNGDELVELVDLAMETDPGRQHQGRAAWGIPDERSRRKAQRGRKVMRTTARVGRTAGGTIPEWAAAAVIADARDPDRTKRIVNLGKDEVRAFIERHHSAFADWNYRGLVFAIGLKIGGRLAAVATANTVPGETSTLELSRIASDGTVPFASSALGTRVLRAMEKTGQFNRLITYSLTSERGSTYRAMAKVGMRPVAWGSRTGGKRSAKRRSDEFKIRWEAGEGARDEDVTILPQLDKLHALDAALNRTGQERTPSGHRVDIHKWLLTYGVDTDTLQKLVAMRGKPARTGRLRGETKRAALVAELLETLPGKRT